MPGSVQEVTADLVTEGLGAFDELERLGGGTYGTTFRAVRGDEEFALKVIHFPNLPKHLWQREVACLQKVEHPNVVGFRASGEFTVKGKRYPYLQCEYIEGGTVADAIAGKRKPDSADDLRAFLSGLLAGVTEIHDLGIIHRDIKPGNIAVRQRDWGQPVLLDFGLARVLDMSAHTAYPAQIGTVAYMSPEQLRAEPARTRSDLFSVGVVTYEAGTGQHPFVRPDIATAQSLHDRIAEGGPTDPRELSKAWPDDVAVVVLRLLSYHAHERLSAARAQRDLEGNS